MSQVTAGVLARLAKPLAQYQPYQIAESLAIIAGAIIAFLGLVRLGRFVDFISLTAITSFITGAALNILVGQVPTLLGINKVKTYVNTRAATYLVIIDTLKNLPHCTLGWSLGVSSLVMLYVLRYSFTLLAKKFPSKARWFFFASTLRTVFVILLYTLISWVCNRHLVAKSYKNAKWQILGPVPRGFQNAHVPIINKTIIKGFASELPVTVIVLLIEHIAISKSFGRINGYTINPSQELLAIGATNLLAPFLGAYPATGSFSRTAIKSKAGVRTPAAGWITAIVVLLAIYALPAVFYWIPQPVLSAVIIHAVGDLIAPPNTVYQFWRTSPLEVLIFFVGVIVTVFSTIEDGIYTTICISVAVLLWRVMFARGRFLGKVTIHSVVGDAALEDAKNDKELNLGTRGEDVNATREVFLPFDHEDGSNPVVALQAPYPGIFIYRFSEGFNYPNANTYLDHMVQTIFSQTRRTNPVLGTKLGDRPWNNPGTTRGTEAEVDYTKPTLKAVILDFSSVNNVDITSVQQLIDVRNQLDRYASPDIVEWHFTSINNRWTKRALASAGFGYPNTANTTGEYRRWKPIYSVAEIGGADSAAAAAESRYNEVHRIATEPAHSDSASDEYKNGGLSQKRIAAVAGVNRPFFHLDIPAALQSAITSVESAHRAPASRPEQV